MCVKKLYYEDCHLASFSATVTGCVPTEKGYLVTLDATAFYPEGGGQACDLGTLNDARVLDVQEREEQVVHLCDRILEVGTVVAGQIDWARRLDLMQQHTGEHIVSGLIHSRYGYHNVGFHMGKDVVTIDFDGPVDPAALQEIEEQANRVVWQNLQVRCWYPGREELPKVPYRRKKDLPWPVRIVEIPGVDICACCGVQAERTGEVGPIKLLSCVKFHEGVRIEMVCGGRAMGLLREIYEQNRQVSQAFSAKPLETGDAARRMNEALAAEKFRATALEKRLFAAIADGYRDAGNVLHFEAALTPNSVRELADGIAGVCGGVAAVLSGEDGKGYSLCLMCRNTDVRTLGKDTFQALSGRGGGKPEAVQGSVQATRAQVEAYFAGIW